MTAATCDGSRHCEAETHLHGCFADRGKCDEPNEHRSAASTSPLDFGELWERTNPRVPSNAYLRDLIHDAEIEAGEEDGDCRLSLGRYTEGVLAGLRELEARRHA